MPFECDGSNLALELCASDYCRQAVLQASNGLCERLRLARQAYKNKLHVWGPDPDYYKLLRHLKEPETVARAIAAMSKYDKACFTLSLLGLILWTETGRDVDASGLWKLWDCLFGERFKLVSFAADEECDHDVYVVPYGATLVGVDEPLLVVNAHIVLSYMYDD